MAVEGRGQSKIKEDRFTVSHLLQLGELGSVLLLKQVGGQARLLQCRGCLRHLC